MAFPLGWNNFQAITIDHTKLAGDETNFPLLLVWTGTAGTSNLDPDIINSSNPFSCNSDGGDIRASSDILGRTQLPVEVVVVSKNATVGSAYIELYVNITSVSSSSDTTIYLWYGNSTATMPAANSTYGSQNVWTNHIAVFHMTGSGNMTDSTANAYTAVATGTTPATGLYNAPSARTFNGLSDLFTITGLIGTPASLTLMAIVNHNAGTNNEVISLGDHAALRVKNDGTTDGFYRQGSTWPTVTSTANLKNQWAQFTYACSPTVSHEIVYGNTTASSDSALNTAIAYTGLGANTILGRNGNSTINYLTGTVEEMRILSVYKPATYITTLYNSMLSANTFIKSKTVLSIPSIMHHRIAGGTSVGIMKGIA